MDFYGKYLVTPFVGVWIETSKVAKTKYPKNVTPFVGVWIETHLRVLIPSSTLVTPFVGVWIETCAKSATNNTVYRHTLRGCVD